MLHDLGYALELDTIVVDEPEAPRPSIPRTRTDGALTMQVLQGGVHHRRTPDLATTACGVPIHSQFAPLRREVLSDPLCPKCFTEFELGKAAEKTAVEREGT